MESSDTAGSEPASEKRTTSEQVGAADDAQERLTVELREEELQAHKQPVQTGELVISKDVAVERRVLEIPVSHEQIFVERRAVERRPLDRPDDLPADSVEQLLARRLRELRPGETIRIPVIEEEVIVQKRPVVREEITIGKRIVEETREVSGTVRREEARLEPRGDVEVREWRAPEAER